MTGFIVAASSLVQTFTTLEIELRPTLDLSSDSYIIMNVPNSIQFQGPSCSVFNMQGGFSKRMSCSRVGFQITLWNPFDYDFEAATADVLSMTVEEFLMPESVQNIGTFQIITYDERDGMVRPIDMLEFETLRTVSGAITKLSEVQSETNATSLQEQTYIFHYQL